MPKANLNNKDFVARAPQEIVAAEQAKLTELELALTKLHEKQADIVKIF